MATLPSGTAEPEPEKPQEKIDFELQQLKMVEQLEEKDEKDAPDDAHYLSNINKDVTEETRAEITNLVKDAEVPKASPRPLIGAASAVRMACRSAEPSSVKTTPLKDRKSVV